MRTAEEAMTSRKSTGAAGSEKCQAAFDTAGQKGRMTCGSGDILLRPVAKWRQICCRNVPEGQ